MIVKSCFLMNVRIKLGGKSVEGPDWKAGFQQNMRLFIMFRLRFFSFLLLLYTGIFTFSAFATDDASIYPRDLTVEMLSNPIGIDMPDPRLGWKNSATRDGYGFEQTAYRIAVASTSDLLDKDTPDLWDSGWIESSESIQIPYDGKKLSSDMKVFWKVQVKDQNGSISRWSPTSSWTTGIISQDDWKAEWIAQPASLRQPVSLDGASWIGDSESDRKISAVRHEFELGITQEDLDAKRYCAILYYAGNKTFSVLMNGDWCAQSFGMVFNPDLLRVTDVTEFLRPGKNVLASEIQTDNGTRPAILLKLVVFEINPIDDLTPGRGTLGKKIFELMTDNSWKSDSSLKKGWEMPETDDASLPNAEVLWEADDAPWGKLRRFGESTSPAFRKEFKTAMGKHLSRATLFISGLGMYEASIDGQKIGNRLLDPAMTRYDRRVLYSAYDLTDKLQDNGETHTLNVLLGHGWYDVRSIVTWNFDAAPWRGNPRLLAQLNLHYDDGSCEVVATDESWDTVSSPVVYDCLRQGEIVDGGFEEKNFGKAERIDPPGRILSASLFPGTMIVQEFPAIRVTPSKEPNTWIVDLGRNIAGWCRVRFSDLPKGKVVRLRYSERMKNGEIERQSIEQHFLKGSPGYFVGETGAFQTDYYISGGKCSEIFEPRFTYNGFQFIEVKGLETAPEPEDFTACVISNGFSETGYLMTDNKLINQIQTATLSSYRANFVDGYPTDCPHREKNGWTGDAQLACEQAMYNWENTAAYEKWIRDLCDEQCPDGNLPGIVPTGGWGYAWGNGPAWDSALILIPWQLYVYRGDKRILENSYDAMKLYVDYLVGHEDNDHLASHGLGDWCAFKNMPPVQVTSSGYYYVDVKIVSQTAKILGKEEEARKYEELAKRIQADYCNLQIDGDSGICSDGSITAQSCSIHQGLVDALSEREKAAVYERLIDRVTQTGYHFDCGILGAKYVLRVLSEGGGTDKALRMVLQKTAPCYYDWIERGAGTLWEDWGDGSSRNHIMFGDISAWFYQYLAGIRFNGAPYPSAGCEPSVPGFREFLIAPNCRRSDLDIPDTEPLTRLHAIVNTPYGIVISSWKRDPESGELTFTASVPENTRAVLLVPYDEGETVVPDEQIPESIRNLAKKAEVGGKKAMRYSVGSGRYVFTVK